MFYTEQTEQTCKMRRFRGIYGLYVNKSAKKTYFFCFGYWRPRVRISRSKIDKLACQAQSADIFSSAENPAITYSIPSRVLRRLDFIVIMRRYASLRSFNSLKSSGASRKTVVNCFSLPYPPLRPKQKVSNPLILLGFWHFLFFCFLL